jgi:hypothetical protein
VLVAALATSWRESGRVESLWREVFAVRRLFVNSYGCLQPLISIRYWREGCQDLTAVRLSDKKFDQLRQIYTDCFETLGRLLLIAIAFEAIIHFQRLEIRTRKGAWMGLDDLERLPNAGRREHLAKFPIEDMFVPLMDTDFRNSIGHSSAHYEPEKDTIILYHSKDGGKVADTIRYTAFCAKLLDLFAGFELAVTYYEQVHLSVDGQF